MASVVHFAADNVSAPVEEDVSDVMSAWREAHGLPFRLTHRKTGEIFVNPATIAYVRDAPDRGAASFS